MKFILTLGVMGLLLSGCSTDTFNPSNVSHSNEDRCKTTKLLITNLAEPSAPSIYLLPNGQQCSASEVDHVVR